MEKRKPTPQLPTKQENAKQDEMLQDEKDELAPLPPQRRYHQRKSIWEVSKPLKPDELVFGEEGQLTSTYFFHQTLGRTRLSNCNSFTWGNPLGYRQLVGRVYYASCIWNDVVLKVGTFIRLGKEVLKVVSLFQATKSFVGRYQKGSVRKELQNRGKAYAELVAFHEKKNGDLVLLAASKWNEGHVEGAPFCLFSKDASQLLVVEKVFSCEECFVKPIVSPRKRMNMRASVELTSQQRALVAASGDSRFGRSKWPEAMEAKWTLLRCMDRKYELLHPEEYTVHECDSDDSDGFAGGVTETATTWYCEMERGGILPRTDVGGRGGKKQPIVLFEGGPILPDKPNATMLLMRENWTLLQPLLENCVGCDPSLKGYVEGFKKAMQVRTVEARLEEFFRIIPSKGSGGPLASKFLGIEKNYKTKIQELACIQAASEEDMRDTVMIAPCGYGKSLVFVSAAVGRGGVHIVVEPLNAIIKSQLRNLNAFADVLQVEQLLNEEDAKHQRSHRAGDRLQEILNDIKMNGCLEKPVLLFTTPELIESCMPQLEALSMVKSLKNLTIDEVDMIHQSHASFRGAYTEILGNLRRHCQGTKFVFLSATVTAAGLAGLLPPMASIHDEKPVLYLNDRALADSLSFEVERKRDDEQVR
jgi:hypothetical protein